ncbi:MAG: hypothetical protein H6613_02710 [Ignavibacteriales bacterium]|nr:hypothetical protein [Ignavibacteriales bacterium]
MDKIVSIVGSSGTIMAAGLMIRSMKEKESEISILNNYTFSYEDLLKIQKKVLSAKSIDDRKKIRGLDEKRADIIPAGIIILATIFEQFGIDKITISGYALREGIIFDSINNEIDQIPQKETKNLRSESIDKLANSCNYDIKHCYHVAELAKSFFHQFADVHKLPDEYVEYLTSASKLHDIGYHISHSKHHKHSQYIIVNSELLGFNENEIRAIACIARYHRKSHPKNSHEEFMMLPKKWKIVVQKLSAILRIVDALDRTHKKLVKNIDLQTDKNKVNISVENNMKDIEIELWSLDRRKELFKEVFGLEISVKSNN